MSGRRTDHKTKQRRTQKPDAPKEALQTEPAFSSEEVLDWKGGGTPKKRPKSKQKKVRRKRHADYG